MPDANVRELQALCSAVGSSFIRLIQLAKEGQLVERRSCHDSFSALPPKQDDVFAPSVAGEDGAETAVARRASLRCRGDEHQPRLGRFQAQGKGRVLGLVADHAVADDQHHPAARPHHARRSRPASAADLSASASRSSPGIRRVRRPAAGRDPRAANRATRKRTSWRSA